MRNIPIRTEIGARIRRGFAFTGRSFAATNFSQLEGRVPVAPEQFVRVDVSPVSRIYQCTYCYDAGCRFCLTGQERLRAIADDDF